MKIIHEFGHGLTAKHYGGEVHEMGILFLVLTPALYCDVTDSWLLPNKWRRIWISAAGIYVECFLASIATFVWWYSTPGLLNSLAMATMFICSVNTIMFNANPLLRYDGYYVMADWLEIPNLRIKSTQFFAYLIQEKVLGLEIPVQSYMPRSRRYLFVTYAVASYIYRWFVTFAILWFLSQVLKPYKLESVSYLLAAGAVVPLVGMPVYQIGKFLRTPGRLRKVKKARAAAYAAAAIALVAGILADPDTVTNRRNTGAQAGEARRGLRRDRRTTRRAERQRRRLGHERHRDRQALQSIQGKGTGGTPARPRRRLDQGPLVSARAPSSRIALRPRQQERIAEQLEGMIEKVSQQLGKLTLIANRDGRVVGSPHKETVGQWVKPGKPFCEVGDPSSPGSPFDHRPVGHPPDQDRLRSPGSRSTAGPRQTFKSQVSEIAKRNREEVPTELSNMAGGEVASKPDPKTGAAKPLTAVYEVIIPIDNADLKLEPGLRGAAKIDGGRYTIAWWLMRWWNKIFNFQL